MAIHVALSHRTRYAYDRPVSLSPHTIRLRPAPHCRTEVLSYSLTVEPGGHFLNWQQDPHGNYLARVVFPEKARALAVDVDLVASLSVINPFDFFLEPGAEQYPFVYDPALRHDLLPYLKTESPGPALAALVASVDRTPRATVDFLVGLNQQLASDIRYIIRMEPGVQTPEETLTLASGSCRDTAWLLVQLLRHLGVAARFVSGYLIQLVPDVKALDGPVGAATDFCDLHAWTEAYLPGAGWVGLDPTSGLLAGEGHLPLAATPDPISAAAITGAVDPCEATLEHVMSVTRIAESPRVTKPYGDEAWARIEALGHAVDARLQTGDVRLTMGGEPTFVSIDDMDGAEWTTDALGARKRELAGTLIRRLRHRFAPGGLLHYGQGKWYPGESLPRWTLGCWWRKDGDPIWADDALIADESRDYGHGPAEAQRFVERLARELAVEAGSAIPAYEDAWYYLWRERRLPTNVDPLTSRLDDAEERARLARVFTQGLDHVAGYVLPVRRLEPAEGGPRWVTGRWFIRREHLFLIPGDSPIGYRLPLDSLPWSAPDDRRLIEPPDPFAPQPALPPRGAAERATARGAWSGTGRGLAAQEAPRPGDSAKGIVRTAVCVEPRQGRLHVFMPPVVRTEDYLDLIAAVERTAEALALPVVIEGTPPHHDDRLQHFSVTPDPGVIEVNLQPSASWDELVERTTVLYEEARLTRLGTEKFMLDGRHTGTGGGNHIVVGGPTPADSPFLRRPDLLKSLVGYWHNHPSLSYLFSGLFIGPTSQHPRVDEARDDAVRELEIAFAQVRQGHVPPWLTDRLFRNLLVDVTGNTHRAEFCIDKLYPPEGAGGRRGLVELRAFEMPPHSRMSLTQQVLLRALIATFWERPYEQPLVRWGTGLHDRFLLPHFVGADLDDVLGDLRRAGFPFEPEWFAPHMEFRFPLCGAIARDGVHLEVRQALEPWHVLGDEPTAGGTVRYVDSSVERLQVKVRGWTGSRYVLAVNGRAIPLHQTGTVGELVAGVRFRAWQPPESLHPTIGVHAPLVFDVIDTWSGRALGGCVYHVAHPGGRASEQFPVNSYAAEGRRLARFSALGHRPGPLPTPPDERDPEFPMTLDLRRPPAAGLTARPLAEPR
ncbi:MAG: DUF2126 domain-containing protein [Vicinamibacterales bacterium]